MDATLGAIAHTPGTVVAQVTVVAEREPAGRVDEGLGVGQIQGGQLRWPPEVDEQAGRLDRTHVLAARIVAERPDVPVAGQPVVGRQPGCTPAEAGDPVAFQLLGERPQFVDPERLGGPRHVVLTHGSGLYGGPDGPA